MTRERTGTYEETPPKGRGRCGRGRNRTGDTVIFSHVLYRLSYPTLQLSRLRSQHGAP